MPTILIYPQTSQSASLTATGPTCGLPQILSTPSGLAILEIQGTINASSGAQQSASGNSPQPVGKLVFPGYDAANGEDDTAWHKRVYLYVGKHQRLTGEVRKLAKPVAVLRRRRGGGGGEGEALEVAEIVRWKLLFAHRPEPVGGEASAGE